MTTRLRLTTTTLLAFLAWSATSRGEGPTALPPALQGVNPRLLSGGLYTALDAAGAFGGRVAPRPARAGVADLSKGKPPAVLDARVGVNIRLGADPAALTSGQTAQAEPHLVRSAANPDLLLATFQEGRYAANGGALDCGYALSRDGGLTWTRALIPQLTQASGGPYRRATDPVAGIGPQGDLYLHTLASPDDAFATSTLLVSRSTDNGATWTAPSVVFQQTTAQSAPDKNWLAVNDYPAAPNSGRLVSTWTNFVSNAAGNVLSYHLLAAVSDDRAATWSAPIAITAAGSLNQGSQPLFLPDGSLVVIYTVFASPSDDTRFSIQCKRSTDGGRTFPATASIVVASVTGAVDPDLRSGFLLTSAAVARQSGALFVGYTATVNGAPRVLVAKSTDQGATWSAPVVVSDNPVTASVVTPGIATTPDGSVVSVFFGDKRNSPVAADGHRYFLDQYAAQSFDGGATWQPNLRLTEMSYDLRYAPKTTAGYMLGDYVALAPSLASDQPCVALWCDTRSGDADPFAVRFLPNSAASFFGWVAVHGIRGSNPYSDDHDADGANDYFEYLDGTDLSRAESGENLFLRPASPTTVDICWTERSSAQRLNTVIDGIATANAATFPTSRFSMSGIALATLTGDQLPTVALPSGLVWRGARANFTPSDGAVFARALKFSAGLPVTAAKMIATLTTDSRLINVATRGQVGAGANQMIVGFVIDGAKNILVRAAGPALAGFGVGGLLTDPRLSLVSGDPAAIGVVTNDNWQQQGSANAALFARLGAFPFALGSLDAALVQPLPAQSYTALVSGASNGTGVALVEAYDADAKPGAPGNPRLVNLSTRANVGTGDNALIAGFVVSGTQPRRMLLRAIGPSLAQFGLGGLLADPQLELFQGATKLAANDDWEISRSSAAIAATAQRVGAFPLNPASLDAALLITLAPGGYTVVVTGVDGVTGLALVEIYDAD